MGLALLIILHTRKLMFLKVWVENRQKLVNIECTKESNAVQNT